MEKYDGYSIKDFYDKIKECVDKLIEYGEEVVMNPPATEEAIAMYEESIGKDILPADYKEWLRYCNGLRIPSANVIHGIGPEIYEWMDVPDGYEQVGETISTAYVFSLKDGKFYEWDEGELNESSCRHMLRWHLEQAEDLISDIECELGESEESWELKEPSEGQKKMLIDIFGIEKYNEYMDKLNKKKMRRRIYNGRENSI